MCWPRNTRPVRAPSPLVKNVRQHQQTAETTLPPHLLFRLDRYCTKPTMPAAKKTSLCLVTNWAGCLRLTIDSDVTMRPHAMYAHAPCGQRLNLGNDEEKRWQQSANSL